MYIVVVNGFPGSGKTTFESMVKNWAESGEAGHNCYILSTIDCIKEIAKKCGWNGEKTPESRKFLSDLKDLTTKYNDYPIQYIESKINKIKDKENNLKTIIFIDCREPNEIYKLVKKFNAKTVLVRRMATEQDVYSNHADEKVLEYPYDYIIENNGYLSDLSNSAITFYQSLNGIIKPQL